MTSTITPLIAGNWKMNGLRGSLEELTELAGMLTTGEAPRALVVICPPATILAAIARQGASAGILAGPRSPRPRQPAMDPAALMPARCRRSQPRQPCHKLSGCPIPSGGALGRIRDADL